MTRTTVIVAAVLALNASGLAGAAHAEDGWTTDLTIYGWLTGIEGDIRAPAFGLGATGSLSPRDVLDNLDGAFFGKVELRNGDFGLILDLVSADLGFDGFAPVSSPVSVRTETSLTMITAVAGWRASRTESTTVDLYGGLRFVSFEAVTSIGPPVSVSRGVGEDWVDPVVGIRAIHQLAPRFGLQGLFDLGGFGAGSDLTVNTYVGGRYSLNESLTAEFGLRYISVDYATDQLDTKTDFWGPAIGLTYSF
jgi:hypothetical protein